MNIRLAETRSLWTTLVLLDVVVSSPSARLYRNGRQQVELTVRVRALDTHGKRVPLSDAQRDSVRLIDCESGRPLPLIAVSGDMTEGWGTTRVRNAYAFFPAQDSRRTPDVNDAKGDECVIWYVQTTDSLPKRIGCEVRRDNDTLLTCAAGGSPSFVELIPKRLPTQDFARSIEYRFERESAFQERSGRGCPMRDVDYYYCGVAIDGQRLGFLSFCVNPASLLRWEGDGTEYGTFCFTGFATPSGTSVRYALPSMLDAHRHRVIARPRAGEGVIVRVFGESVHVEGAEDLPWQSCRIEAIDEYGTEHTLSIAFDRAAQRTLVLRVAS